MTHSITHIHNNARLTSEIENGVRYRYRSIRTERARTILQIQHALCRALRDLLDSEGFVEILAPIIGPLTDPGIRGAQRVDVSFYGRPYTIMTSMILYKQMVISTFPRMYSFSPNVRIEPVESADTQRHLAEFYQLDLEVANGTCESLMDLGDLLLSSTIRRVREQCREQLEYLGRDLPVPPRRLPRVSYAEAVEILRGEGIEMRPNEELPWEAERLLATLFDTPFWVTEYPVGSRGFYYLEDPLRPGILRTMDLLLPEGYGEVASGGERENTLEGVIRQMQRTGEDPSKYGWYIDMLREGVSPSAGFGIGIERLTRYVCGVENIWECSPFPKVPGLA